MRKCAEGAELHKHLRRKLEGLPTIEQARGIIMTLRRCDQDTAFAELLQLSRQSSRKLRDIAAALVAHAAGQATAQPDQTLDDIVAQYWGHLDGPFLSARTLPVRPDAVEDAGA